MKNIFPYVLIFLGTFTLMQWLTNSQASDPILSSGPIGLKATESAFTIGNEVKILVQNNQDEPWILEDPCPAPKVQVLKVNSTGATPVENTLERDCSKAKAIELKPGEKTSISLANYAHSLLGEAGTYKVSLDVMQKNDAGEIQTQTLYSPEFNMENPGFIKSAFRHFISYPILNLLVGIVVYMPGHHLGLGIILLTLVIRTILLIPSQRAMRAQKRMQEIQPRLEELKTKYANDQARLAQETMLIWKETGVNPLSSCLPILIQLPILIALFYAIQNGLNPDSQKLIYSFIPQFSLSDIDPWFGPFNLFEKDAIVFPLTVGLLQFLQMKLMMNASKKKGSKLPPEMESMNKVMTYMMPAMIAIFTAQTPAAVGLYWGVGTCYGIVQQIVVNRERPQAGRPNDEVQIRVVNKHHS